MTLDLSEVVIVALTGLQHRREGQAVIELDALGDVQLFRASVGAQQSREFHQRSGTGFQAHSISGGISEEMSFEQD